ncbi:hypothetical protein Tco_0170509 [Tanacetum coccineum]
MQGVSKTDFENYVKANDAVLFLVTPLLTRRKTYQGPTITTTTSPKVVERRTEPVVAPVGAPMPNPKPSIPYPSRRNDEKRRENANKQIEKFYEIFKDMSFEISFMDALTLMPKFASTLKALIGNKEKLSEIVRNKSSYDFILPTVLKELVLPVQS